MAEPGPQERGVSRRPRILDYIGAGGIEESEAREYAQNMVRFARETAGRRTEGPPPDPDAVRARRTARRHTRDISF
jgi:hypothetical protein